MKLAEIMAGLDVTVVRDGDVQGFGSLELRSADILHYYGDRRFAGRLAALPATRCVVTTTDLADDIPQGFGLAIGADPKQLFLQAYLRHGEDLTAAPAFPNEIAATARVHPRAVIGAHSIRLGDGVVIDANAVIQARVSLEAGVRIGPGSVIGSSGFEVGIVDGRQILVPHHGGVLIRSGAVLLANTCVACGIYGQDTEIGRDSMLDNQVHVAHNVRIGERCLLMAAAMLAGSCILEDDVRIGPNATISNGLRIGRGARVTLGAVVTRDVPAGGHVTGHFAVPHARFLDLLRADRLR